MNWSVPRKTKTKSETPRLVPEKGEPNGDRGKQG